MKPLSATTPEAARVQAEILRSMLTWRKWQLVGQLNAMVRRLALSELRHQYPHATEAELQRRLADRLLGPELAEKVYGPLELTRNGKWPPPRR